MMTTFDKPSDASVDKCIANLPLHEVTDTIEMMGMIQLAILHCHHGTQPVEFKTNYSQYGKKMEYQGCATADAGSREGEMGLQI
mmetsp:Transcript_47342/g.47778  ORF Transcript_47342/g.47778 Transcript_47342/m.47778 type:complete len:84 (+) Transcript_47342:417-668(+)